LGTHEKAGGMSDLISTKGLTKRFGGLVAVDGVEFLIQEGQVAGVMGPNGSGKTTLFNLLSGLFSPSEVEIHFKGKDITRMPPHKRVEMGMARTFQLVSVFDSLTAWENLVLSTIRFRKGQQTIGNLFFAPAQKRTILNSCLEALEMVGLAEQAGKPTSELSYGEKRMLEIGISLSLKPTLLLLDEPLAGLSDHEISEVLTLIDRVKKDFTLVIIEHKISKIMDLVETLSVINLGRIICQGNPEQVLCETSVRECYWGKETDTCSM
jgi:branched-chain amino acid transport system ATP-binding protein